MKKRKIVSFLAILLALIMVLAPFASVHAAMNPHRELPGNVTITINGDGREYQAYKLMTLTTGLKSDCGHGEGETHTADCYTYAYAINEKYRAVLTDAAANAVSGNSHIYVDDAGLISFLNNLSGQDIRSFADYVYQNMGDMAADYVSDKNVIRAPQGYYLIMESKLSNDPDTRSLVMLDTAGQEGVTVEAKEDTAALVKKVKLGSNSALIGSFDDKVNEALDDRGYADAVMAELNDCVYFYLEADLPSNIGSYEKYFCQFQDFLQGSLTYDSIYSMTLDGHELDVSDYEIQGAISNVQMITATIPDLKAAAERIGVTLTGDSKLRMTYGTSLNDKALPGAEGNLNAAIFVFSNDPYNYGKKMDAFKSKTDYVSETEPDMVKVFTTALTVNKTDKSGDPLSGALFNLVSETSGETFNPSIDETGTVFLFSDLGLGNFVLTETDVPDGYHEIDPVTFTIEADYETESDNPQLLSLTVKQNGKVVSEGENAAFQVSEDMGNITITVINESGTRLPDTGEFGRAALLYGGIGAILAAVILAGIGKRRSKEQ